MLRHDMFCRVPQRNGAALLPIRTGNATENIGLRNGPDTGRVEPINLFDPHPIPIERFWQQRVIEPC